MKLWTAYVPALEGFYASDVYVSATHKDQAIALVMRELGRYIQDLEDQYRSVPGAGCYDPEDPEYPALRTNFRHRVQMELNERLHPILTNALIKVST